MEKITRLFPSPQHDVALRGMYLDENIHRLGSTQGPFVYANFVTSLDGRIALKGPAGAPSFIPRHLTSSNDFRLFLELHAQADCLVTHGGYLRALANQRLGNILQVGAHDLGSDLRQWRKSRGLTHQPAVVVVSATLDFTLPDSLTTHGQQVLIATGEKAERSRVAAWEERGFRVLFAGAGNLVDGKPLVQALGKLGYSRLYLIAGPQLLDAMLRDGRLDRVYLTMKHQFIGGTDFHSIVPGSELGAAGRLAMKSLYYDSSAEAGSGQWFARFDSVRQVAI